MLREHYQNAVFGGQLVSTVDGSNPVELECTWAGVKLTIRNVTKNIVIYDDIPAKDAFQILDIRVKTAGASGVVQVLYVAKTEEVGARGLHSVNRKVLVKELSMPVQAA